MKISWPKWRTWGEGDWGVLARCLWLIPAAELAVRWLPPRHWLPPAAGEGADAAAGARAAEVARWVEAAYRRSPFASSCLTRTLALRPPPRLRIGVARPGGPFEAQAGVGGAGAPLNDRDALHQHFAPLNNTRAGL